MKLAVVALVLVLTALSASVGVAPSHAQGALDLRSSDARGEFPDGISFSLDAASDAGFDEIRLVYQIAPDGVRATALPECTGDAVVRCTFQLVASNRTILIPGAEVTYFWRVTIGGERIDTEPQLLVYEDTRFEWRQLSEGNLTILWYDGSEDDARAVLAAAREALEDVSALLETSVDFPVKVRYYASASDMQAAIISDNRQGVVTLGEVVYSDTAMVAADASPQEIARHEIAHVVIRQALRGPFGVPDWMNEGTAVFAQDQPLGSQQQALDAAIRAGQVFSIRSLSSSSVGSLGSRVALFYGQSWSTVDFLISTYGEQAFAELFRAFDDGATTEEALQQVYGFNQDGLENAWRESVGLPPRDAPTPDADAIQDPPTDSAPTSEPVESPATNGGDGSSTIVIVVIVILTVVLAGGFLGAGLYLARRYR